MFLKYDQDSICFAKSKNELTKVTSLYAGLNVTNAEGKVRILEVYMPTDVDNPPVLIRTKTMERGDKWLKFALTSSKYGIPNFARTLSYKEQEQREYIELIELLVDALKAKYVKEKAK